MDAALAGDDALARALGQDVVPGWATFREALRPTRDALVGEPIWGTRLFVSGDPPELVGWGGFKGPPDDGVVEVGYEIAEAPHTLAERNASNRVLEKAGFSHDGEGAEDGEVVWRYSLARL
jgi:[ribosomal protein S5]-alanine N-acetyltransferase